MAARAGFFIIVVLFGMKLDSESRRELIVWNVGQGQWVTIVSGGVCWHFDAGGERAPFARVARACRELENRVTFSHWDSDHVGFAGRLASLLPDACVQAAPVGAVPVRKARLLSRLRSCFGRRPFVTWANDHARGSNARSRVSLWQNVLIPGDATRAEERRFVDAFTRLGAARWLVLGHHGSRTSTSPVLLDAMPRLLGAIASARHKRYGHPHAEVRRDLRAHGVPLLSTEEWGDIHVAL